MSQNKSKFDILSNVLKGLGNFLIKDDKFDLGKFKYKAHGGHPDHPSSLHHWQVGVITRLFGDTVESIGKLRNIINEFNKSSIPKTKENLRKWILLKLKKG